MIDTIRAIIFDYGGTLDSRGDHWSEVIRRAYEAEGIHVTRRAFRDAYVYAERALDGSGIILPDDNFLAVMRKKIALQFKHLGIDGNACSPSARATPDPATAGYDTLPPAISPLADAVATRCYESARECVRESAVTLARLAIHYPLGIVSNFYGNVRAVLDDFGLTPMLTAVIDSSAIGIRKPDPAIFTAGIKTLGTAICDTSGNVIDNAPLRPAEVLVVGDSIDKDILPAASLGCQTALIQGTPWDPSRPQAALPPSTIPLTRLSDLLVLFHNNRLTYDNRITYNRIDL